mgnify:CR=1 FL=1
MALKTIDNPGVAWQEHIVNVPPLCPRTGNPVEGSTITIGYQPDTRLLEVYSLRDYIAGFAGSESVRDLEQLICVVAHDCRLALGVPVVVQGNFVLHIGQTVICKIWN